MTTWLYICGRGHSGSTMLDAMLGNSFGIESVGELVSGMGRYEALCSCGLAFKDCTYWSEVRRRFEVSTGAPWGEGVRASLAQAHLKRFFDTLIVSSSVEWVQQLKAFSEQIANAVAQSKNDVIVDSSKEITRALFLIRFVPGSRVIHLVRSPEKVLQSNYHRLKKGSGFKLLRMRFTPRRGYGLYLFVSAVSWLAGNLLAEVVRLFGKDRFLRVKYEDLIAAPIEELDRIEKFIGVSLDEVKKKVTEKQTFDVGHNIGGNQMRMAGTFVLDPKKADRTGMPIYYKVMANLVCWPLLRVYGYRQRK